MHDVTFTHDGIRYGTDADTYRILFEVAGTKDEGAVMARGLLNDKIKEAQND